MRPWMARVPARRPSDPSGGSSYFCHGSFVARRIGYIKYKLYTGSISKAYDETALMNHHHLNLFRIVAETGSFRAAAEVLHLSQPALSMQVAEFERVLDLPLFDRLGRGVRLTAGGTMLLPFARGIHNLTLEAERAVEEFKGLRQGVLNLGVSTTIGNYWLPRLLADFRGLHRGIEIQTLIGNTEKVLGHLCGFDIELALIEGERPAAKGLAGRVFLEDEIVLIAPTEAKLPLNQKGALTPTELLRLPLIGREMGSGTRTVIEHRLASKRLKLPKQVLTLASTEAIKRAVLAGMGFALVSLRSIEWEVQAGRLRTVPIQGLEFRRPLHLLWLTDRTLSPTAKAFAEMLPGAKEA
jgi:DNA-binding transcriptional LysR family regulator